MMNGKSIMTTDENIAYYIINDKDLKNQINDSFDKFEEHVKSLLFKFKCSDDAMIVGSDGKICGLKLQSPDLKKWKEVKKNRSFYMPRLNTKDGKKLHEEIGKVSRIDTYSLGKMLFGKPFIVIGLNIQSPGLETINGELVVSVYDSTEWKPVNGLRRINTSEYWQMKESIK